MEPVSEAFLLGIGIGVAGVWFAQTSWTSNKSDIAVNLLCIVVILLILYRFSFLTG